MCITYSVLSCKLGTIFSTFSIFILSGKILVNHYGVHVILQDIEQQLQEKFRHHFLHCSYLSIYIKLRSIFYPLKIIYRKLLRYSPTISSIYIPLLKIRRSFFFIIIFHVFLISFCILINRVTYSSSYTFFYH